VVYYTEWFCEIKHERRRLTTTALRGSSRAVSAVSAAYAELLRAARRWSKTPEEARDLVQTALTEAVARGFSDWDSEGRRGWLHGVIRRQAAFQARGEARRQRRERLWELDRDRPEPGNWAWAPQFLSTLAPSLRAVALLTQAGLGSAEVQSVLRLTGVAFRQRLTALRRALGTAVEPTVAAGAPPGPGLADRRRGVLSTLRRRPRWAVGSHDPDGHPLIFVAGSSRTGG
jgi:DNA-directed RNA polymerase specialized sigma24 family protein